ncbi:uncharacterized protein AC631_03172 [Debaryomyces fabryi]|uniref:Cyclin-domain-containing protein n=1 Tax=Debaryomyces fabryi TaxID=58627 RepID=A0A0V1PXR1_9ASCO|nr:uncharacterized protein AC631_03172 [Debaryomyces fabryi]KSA01048.1 hypothetical protein AC631_03172 [Debaryomyces fabryi]CUM47617.1 unnamed protein product [Debaryomyces fabryi]
MSSQYNNPEAGSSTQQKGSISNLTRNLLSSSQQQIGKPPSLNELSMQPHQTSGHPSSYNTSHASSFNKFIPTEDDRGNNDLKVSQSIDYHNSYNYNNPNSHFTNFSYPNQPSFIYRNNANLQYIPSNNDSVNYIPSGHNTPTAVSSSYSSINSYTPAMPGGNSFGVQTQPQHNSAAQSLRPAGLISTGQPTTNISIESVNTANQSLSSSSINSSRIPQPGTSTNSNYGFDGSKSFQYQPQLHTNSYAPNPSQSMPTNINKVPAQNQEFQSQQLQLNSYNNQQSHFFQEPDHYMTYKEFLQNLTSESSEDDDDEHLDIVDYPVNDLILMLSCLLTKIIEANDKLHPNHFDNTIAVRQKMKEEKKNKKLEKLKQKQASIDSNIDPDDLSNDDYEDDDEDDDDEMKNKYLANVLAFHGTNVPGISLHAYLARVLKYCPVTNEVFLSLLVYFDRIAKKANNLKQFKSNDGEQDQEQEPEQLFVMDSYNIHRLIISGITVSSKFFSDIFYKNLRYAKVGGLPLEELNYLELQFLLLLDFKLMISVEDLQNYGDLLLRFWKREQVTNELVNGPQSPSQMNG